MPAFDPWAPLADRFVDGHYATLRGRVRTYVIDAHLRDHLPKPPCALVDVGGGAGNQSIPLARDGYQVTIVDPSEAMLARARARMAAGSTAFRRRAGGSRGAGRDRLAGGQERPDLGHAPGP